MNINKTRDAYEAPVARCIFLPRPLNLLVTLSAEGGIDDFEVGEEL